MLIILSLSHFAFASHVTYESNTVEYEYYIPLTEDYSGNYGDDSDGLCSDSDEGIDGETGIGTCEGESAMPRDTNDLSSGWLDLNLEFDVPNDATLLTLEITFDDLDLEEEEVTLNAHKASNPDIEGELWETADFYYGSVGGNLFASLVKDQRSNTNDNSQTYVFDLSSFSGVISNNIFTIGLHLTAFLSAKKGCFHNTPDSLSALVKYTKPHGTPPNSIPEPSALLLLMIGLIGLGISAKRKTI